MCCPRRDSSIGFIVGARGRPGPRIVRGFGGNFFFVMGDKGNAMVAHLPDGAPAVPCPKDRAHPFRAPMPFLLSPHTRLGTVVGVPTRIYGVLPVEHVGLLAGFLPDGEPRILHASRYYGLAVETSLAGFCHAAVGLPRALGYPSTLPADLVLLRARRLLGQKYDWRRNNCEHFVCEAHDLPRRSPQWDAWRERLAPVRPNPWGT